MLSAVDGLRSYKRHSRLGCRVSGRSSCAVIVMEAIAFLSGPPGSMSEFYDFVLRVNALLLQPRLFYPRSFRKSSAVWQTWPSSFCERTQPWAVTLPDLNVAEQAESGGPYFWFLSWCPMAHTKPKINPLRLRHCKPIETCAVSVTTYITGLVRMYTQNPKRA